MPDLKSVKDLDKAGAAKAALKHVSGHLKDKLKIIEWVSTIESSVPRLD